MLPKTFMLPLYLCISPKIADNRLDFPDPVKPTIATSLFFSILKDKLKIKIFWSSYLEISCKIYFSSWAFVKSLLDHPKVHS